MRALAEPMQTQDLPAYTDMKLSRGDQSQGTGVGEMVGVGLWNRATLRGKEGCCEGFL